MAAYENMKMKDFRIKFSLAVLISVVFLAKVNASEWIQRGNVSYYFSETRHQQPDALEMCREMNASLLSVGDEHENEIVIELFEELFTGIAYWIGLWATDPCSNCSHSGFTTVEDCEICREGWIWLDGTPYQFQNWSTYEPGSSHPCATIGGRAAKWYDATCTRYQRYICERSDIDACIWTICEHNGTCSDTPSGFQCDCHSGWEGSTCEQDINECDENDLCGQYGTCQNTNGSFECACEAGWTGQSCNEDVDECQLTICEQGACSNTLGGFQCECALGWTGITCNEDINECTENICGENGFCENTLGNFVCLCNDGWEGSMCDTDVNECSYLVRSDFCTHGVCDNTDGSYNCTCDTGYSGQRCDQKKEGSNQSDSPLPLGITIGIALLVAVLIIVTIVATVACYRLRRSSSSTNKAVKDEERVDNKVANENIDVTSADTEEKPGYETLHVEQVPSSPNEYDKVHDSIYENAYLDINDER